MFFRLNFLVMDQWLHWRRGYLAFDEGYKEGLSINLYEADRLSDQEADLIKLEVTASDGKTVGTYAVRITRPPPERLQKCAHGRLGKAGEEGGPPSSLLFRPPLFKFYP